MSDEVHQDAGVTGDTTGQIVQLDNFPSPPARACPIVEEHATQPAVRAGGVLEGCELGDAGLAGLLPDLEDPADLVRAARVRHRGGHLLLGVPG